MIVALALTILGAMAGAGIVLIVARLAERPWSAGEAGSSGPLALARPLVQPPELDGRALARITIVAGATAALFALAGARYDDGLHLAFVLTAGVVLVACAAVDIESFRVPNALTYPAIAGALVVAFTVPDASALSALGGGMVAGAVLLVPALLTRGMGMGMGDVKLALFAGLAVGIEHVAALLLLMALSGGAVAGLLLVTRLRERGEPIPYAPFIAGGALVTLLVRGSLFGAV